MALTKLQKRFIDDYLIDLNATRAYRDTYKSCKKDETARANSSKLLANPSVCTYLDKRMIDRQKRTEITQDRIIAELAAIAFANGSDFSKVVEKQAYRITEDGQSVPVFNEDGNPVMYQIVELAPTDDILPEKRKAISGIKQGKNGIEVTSYDKIRALELLGKHQGLFKDKLEVSGNVEVNNPYANLTSDELRKLINSEWKQRTLQEHL